MKCLLCKDGNTTAGKTEVTLDRGNFKIVIRNVPALICRDCCEIYINEEISVKLLGIAEAPFPKNKNPIICNFPE